MEQRRNLSQKTWNHPVHIRLIFANVTTMDYNLGYLAHLVSPHDLVGNEHDHEHTLVVVSRLRIMLSFAAHKKISPAVMALTSRAFGADPNDVPSTSFAPTNPWKQHQFWVLQLFLVFGPASRGKQMKASSILLRRKLAPGNPPPGTGTGTDTGSGQMPRVSHQEHRAYSSLLELETCEQNRELWRASCAPSSEFKRPSRSLSLHVELYISTLDFCSILNGNFNNFLP